MINITLNLFSNSEHTSQIITGFLILEKSGEVKLNINRMRFNKYLPHIHLIEAIFEDTGKVIVYDLLDGYNCDMEVLNNYLDNIDVYFKRSYCSKINSTIENGDKIFPLGFNYHITIKNNPLDKPSTLKDFGEEILRSFLKKDKKRFTKERLELIPTYQIPNRPNIIFCTRLWSPEGEQGEGVINDILKAERFYINNMRVSIIRELRGKFKDNFIGGIADTEYARINYPELILSPNITCRENYLKILKKSDICIGSMGLHESIGWKTGEYISHSKAIINERFKYRIPGDFKEGLNYLAFTDACECISHVEFLMNNPKEIIKMQNRNYNYYLQYLRPDKIVQNTLNQIIKP